MVFMRVITIEGAGSVGHKACAAWISTARRHSAAAVTHAGRGGARCRAGSGGGGRPRVTGVALAAERSRRGHPQPRHGSASLAPRSRPAWSISPPRRVAPPTRPPRRFTTIWQLQNKPASWLSDGLPSPPPRPQQRLCSSLSDESSPQSREYLTTMNEQTRIYGLIAYNFHNYLSTLLCCRRNWL